MSEYEIKVRAALLKMQLKLKSIDIIVDSESDQSRVVGIGVAEGYREAIKDLMKILDL